MKRNAVGNRPLKQVGTVGLVGAVLGLVVLVSSAAAAVIVGTNRGERLIGTNGPDSIAAKAGRDRVFAMGGNDTVGGGRGNDRLYGGFGDDTIYGRPGRDLIAGGPGNDRSYGGRGNDVIFANRGADESFGGDGNDVLWALARADVPLPGVDTLHGENGNDRFRTRDGEPDVIDCGAGHDVALLDGVDVIFDATTDNPNGSCEVVKRAAPKPKDDRDEKKNENRHSR